MINVSDRLDVLTDIRYINHYFFLQLFIWLVIPFELAFTNTRAGLAKLVSPKDRFPVFSPTTLPVVFKPIFTAYSAGLFVSVIPIPPITPFDTALVMPENGFIGETKAPPISAKPEITGLR